MSKGKTCTIEGCERPHRARGLCTTHRYRLDNGLPMEVEVRQYEHERTCKVEGCERTRVGGGDGTYCAMHRRRMDRHGEVGEAAPERAPFNEAVWSQPNVRRQKKLMEQYGLTVEQYDELLLKQNGRCAICQGTHHRFTRAKSDRPFCIDHDHETGAVRGLLCSHCNRGIGLLGDDPAVVEAAAQYLRNHQSAPGRPVADLVEESAEWLREYAPHLLKEE